MEENQFSNFETQQKLPNATAVLVLGILSIITCCCYGIFGLILAIIALVLAKKDLNSYKANPSLYTNYSNLNTGRILAIIGIVLNVLMIIYFAWVISLVGLDGLQNQELMEARIREAFGV